MTKIKKSTPEYLKTMKMQIPQIYKYLREKGLVPKQVGYGLFVVINGVKVEWNTGEKNGCCMVVGYDNSDTDREQLYSLINKKLGRIYTKPTGKTIRFCIQPTLEEFYILVDLIEKLEFEIENKHPESGRSNNKSVYSHHMFLVNQIDQAIESGDDSIIKRAEAKADELDPYNILGRTDEAEKIVNERKAKEKGVTNNEEIEDELVEDKKIWREHLVPFVYLMALAKEMRINGESKIKVAQFIRRYSCIVIVSVREKNIMDSDLKLQTTMPAGWKPDDSEYARLDAAKINY